MKTCLFQLVCLWGVHTFVSQYMYRSPISDMHKRESTAAAAGADEPQLQACSVTR
jgi:hypothetical protein